MKKKFPDFKTDEEAEEFVAAADLSEYDLSDMAPMRFELRKKDRAVSLRLPEKLYEAVKIPNQVSNGTIPFPANEQSIRDGISLEFRFFYVVGSSP